MESACVIALENSLGRSHARSEEEDDLLARSIKKVRSEDPSLGPPLHDTVMDVENSEPVSSFQDILIGCMCSSEHVE